MQTQTSDEQALVEAAQRDPGAFAALYDRHFDRVYSYASRRTRTREEAEDITAEVFQRALAKIGDFEWRGRPFVAWLYRIAANLLADRAGAVTPVASDEEPVDVATAQQIEQRALLFELVAQLPPEQRRVVELRFGEQRSVSDIARQLQRSEGAVKQLQFRALQNLRAALRGDAGGKEAANG